MSWVLGTAFEWITSRLDSYTPSLTVWLAFPIMVVAISWSLSIIRSVFFRVMILLVIPAAQVLAMTSYALLLTTEFLGTQVFRLCRLRPPKLIYRFGDGVTASKPVLMKQLGVASQRTDNAFRRRRSRLWLLALIAVLGWWNTSYCSAMSTVDCSRGPASAWAHSVNGALRDLFTRDG